MSEEEELEMLKSLLFCDGLTKYGKERLIYLYEKIIKDLKD